MLELEHAIFLALCGAIAIPYGLFAQFRYVDLMHGCTRRTGPSG